MRCCSRWMIIVGTFVLFFIGASLRSADSSEPGTQPSDKQAPATPATPPAKTARGGVAPGPAENMNENRTVLEKPPAKPAEWLVVHDPVTPDAAPEAKALLKFLYDISLKHTAIGQHNFLGVHHLSTALAARGLEKTPALYGTDWGFSRAGDIDTIYARDITVQELIKEYRDNGSIIAFCWHEVRPTADEPVTFQGSPTSVQGHLSNAEWEQLMTPGSEIHKKWCAQVDVVAGYMKQLQDAHVPILWRPLHEMNGDWFWWGGRLGERGTKQLYHMMFDRMVKYHKLKNLIWVWNCDQPSQPDRQFVDYFPGQQFVDVLALDCYGQFQQRFYEEMNSLSDGKVMAISECGSPPGLDIYKTQPKWTYYMPWATVRNPVTDNQTTPPPTVDAVAGAGRGGRSGMGGGFGDGRGGVNAAEMAKDPRMWGLEDAAYRDAFQAVRAASGLPPLKPKEPAPKNEPAGKDAPPATKS
jgi:hypothetical protein